jgi:SAM-dependent methyltransferase
MSCCCCDEFTTAADEQFNAQRAASDLEAYRTKGPGVTTRLLRDSLAAAGPIAGSLLDIGAGVGVLTFELLERGVTRAIAIDASAAYVAAGSEEAARRGYAGAVRFIQDDFLHAAGEMPSATIVTLDRVICCYPRYEPLLNAALRHADEYFALSYPRDVLYVRAGDALSNAIRRFKGRTFRTFVHSATQMATIITRAGFERVARRRTLTWCVDVYKKTARATSVGVSH